MALKGSLKDFPLSDIFQLIGQQQKSGSLFIINQQIQIRLVFLKGNLILGNIKGKDALMLGNMLCSAGLVSEGDLGQVLEEQKVNKRSLGDLLLRKKLIDPEDFKFFIRLQLDEILFELFQWKAGDFEFSAGKINIKEGFFESLRPEGALMEQFRRQDEWPAILASIQSIHQTYLQKSSEVDALDFAKIDHPQAQAIYQLLRKPKSAEELAYVSRLGLFEAASVLSKLINASLVEALEVQKKTVVKEIFLLPRSVGFVFFFVFLMSALFFSPQSHFFQSRFSSVSFSKLQSLELSPLRQLRTDFQRTKLQQQIELFFLENQRYPFSLKELELSPSITKQWLYVLGKSDYQLFRKDF